MAENAGVRREHRLRLVLLFAGLGLLGGLAVAPYAAALLAADLQASGVSVWTVALASGAQSAILCGLAAAVGLLTLKRAGLALPYFQAIIGGAPIDWERLQRLALEAAGMGTLAALVIVALDSLVFGGLAEAGAQPVSGRPALAISLLASFYGGVVEEILLRLGLMTALAALLTHVWKGADAPRIWLAIGLTALLFGLGHLPVTAALVPLTAAVVARAIMLNGIGGLLFGWLYWQRGLLLAMAAHLAADVALQLIGTWLT